jgi:Fuc2NAc and GlcNAc transferase
LVALLGVAAVGWIDDRRGLGVRVRLMVHLLSGSAVAQLAVAEASATRTFSAAVALMWLCWLLWTASAINVVNFMDGIDGLVASQGAIAMGSIAWLAPASGLARPFGLLVGAACVGFLVWNWPPARIFLGDVGSGSLGFLLAVAGALLFREVDLDPVRIYLPLFPLFLDSAWTMLRRLRNRERLTVAHRSHLYQRLANGPWGHGRVTLVFVVAALAGALVATVDNAASRWVLTGAYAVLVLRLGMSLDRRAPFVWRARASGVSKPERTGAVSFTKSRGDPT